MKELVRLQNLSGTTQAHHKRIRASTRASTSASTSASTRASTRVRTRVRTRTHARPYFSEKTVLDTRCRFREFSVQFGSVVSYTVECSQVAERARERERERDQVLHATHEFQQDKKRASNRMRIHTRARTHTHTHTILSYHYSPAGAAFST
jgi:hypothetical protein